MYCGTDIIEVDRIRNAIESNNKFIDKIYSKNEQNIIETNNLNSKYIRYAGRFAAKEAVYKAISKIINDNNITFKFNEIEILNNNNGKPYINFLDNKLNILMKDYTTDISISHIEKMASATCLVIK